MDKEKQISPEFEGLVHGISPKRIIDFSIYPMMICPMCECIFWNPQTCSTPECGRTLCEPCLKLTVESRETCEDCLQPTKYDPNPYITKAFKSLKFKCENHPKCPEAFTYGDLPYHICEHSHMKCKIAGCEWEGERKDLEAHMSQCPREIILCENEGCGSKIQRGEMGMHRTYCMFENVECLKLCGFEGRRGELEEHLGSLCPLVELECGYEGRGCTYLPLRRDYQDHMHACLYQPMVLQCGHEVNLKDEKGHSDVCDDFPLPCSQCEYIFTRRQLVAHRCFPFLHQLIVQQEKKNETQEHKIEVQEHKIEAQEHKIETQELNIEVQDLNIEAQEHKIKAQEHNIEKQEHKIETQERNIEAQEHKIISMEQNMISQKNKNERQEYNQNNQILTLEDKITSQDNKITTLESIIDDFKPQMERLMKEQGRQLEEEKIKKLIKEEKKEKQSERERELLCVNRVEDEIRWRHEEIGNLQSNTKVFDSRIPRIPERLTKINIFHDLNKILGLKVFYDGKSSGAHHAHIYNDLQGRPIPAPRGIPASPQGYPPPAAPQGCPPPAPIIENLQRRPIPFHQGIPASIGYHPKPAPQGIYSWFNQKSTVSPPPLFPYNEKSSGAHSVPFSYGAKKESLKLEEDDYLFKIRGTIEDKCIESLFMTSIKGKTIQAGRGMKKGKKSVNDFRVGGKRGLKITHITFGIGDSLHFLGVTLPQFIPRRI